MKPSKNRPLVLIADDEPLLLEVLSFQLQSLECDFELASNGAEALAMIQARQYDLIITDVNMPEMSGLDLLRRVRELGIKTHVIVITGNPDREKMLIGRQYGGFDFLEKPVRVDHFNQAVRSALVFKPAA